MSFVQLGWGCRFRSSGMWQFVVVHDTVSHPRRLGSCETTLQIPEMSHRQG